MEGYIYLTLMFFTSGFSTIFIKILLNQNMSPFVLQFYTSVISLIIFILLNIRLINKKIVISPKEIYVNSIAALTGFVIFEICFNLSMQYMSVTEAMILYYLNPIFLYFLGIIFLKNESKISKKKILGLFLSFLGAYFTITKDSFFSLSINLEGILYMLFAIVSVIFFIIFNKKNKVDDKSYLFFSSVFSITICSGQMLTTGDKYFPNLMQIFYLIIIAILYNLLNAVFYLKASKKIPIDKFTTLSYISPIITSILSIIILKEKLYFTTIIGLILVMTGNLIAK